MMTILLRIFLSTLMFTSKGNPFLKEMMTPAYSIEATLSSLSLVKKVCIDFEVAPSLHMSEYYGMPQETI